MGGQCLGNAASQSAESLVFFSHHHGACCAWRIPQGWFVQRFDGVDVEDFSMNALLGEFQRSLDRFPNQMTACGDGDI